MIQTRTGRGRGCPRTHARRVLLRVNPRVNPQCVAVPDVDSSVAKWLTGVYIQDCQLELERQARFAFAKITAHELVGDIIRANLLLSCDRVAYGDFRREPQCKRSALKFPGCSTRRTAPQKCSPTLGWTFVSLSPRALDA